VRGGAQTCPAQPLSPFVSHSVADVRHLYMRLTAVYLPAAALLWSRAGTLPPQSHRGHKGKRAGEKQYFFNAACAEEE